MQILNQPRCTNYEKCGNGAIGLFGKVWVCGDCMVKAKKKYDKFMEEIALEE